MSNTKREPLKEQDIFDACERYADNYPIEGRITTNSMAMRRAVEPLVEAARAKDAELIQAAVDMAHSRAYEWTDKEFRDMLCDKELAFLAAAEAAGFKPSGR